MYGRLSAEAMFEKSLGLELRGFFAILVCLCGSKGYCYPSIPQLRELTGLGRSTVYRYLNQLENAGYILRSTDPITRQSIIRNLKDPHHASTH